MGLVVHTHAVVDLDHIEGLLLPSMERVKSTHHTVVDVVALELFVLNQILQVAVDQRVPGAELPSNPGFAIA